MHIRTRMIVCVLAMLMYVGGQIVAKNGSEDGQIEDIGGTTTSDVGGAYHLEATKTIEAVDGKENYFDITLKTMKKELEQDTSSDVIIVLDISNTMTSKISGSKETKLQMAKTATNTFIEQYASNTQLDMKRQVGVVTFNSHAEVALSLTEANDVSDYQKIASKVNAIVSPNDNDVKFTNIEAGLRLAHNLLKTSQAKYKYVILITDGFPTTYAKSDSINSLTKINGYDVMMSGQYNKQKAEVDVVEGYFANTRTKVLCTTGTYYSDRGAKKAVQAALEIKNSGINVFSVGIDLSGQDITEMRPQVIDTTGMAASDNYQIGTNTASYETWLRDQIAGGPLLDKSQNRYCDAQSVTQLQKDYEAILKDIEQAPKTVLDQFYTEDTLGKDISFVGFYNDIGQLVTTLSEMDENSATFNKQILHWDMLDSVSYDEGDKEVYTLKYRIRLMNENSEYVDKTTVNTNQSAKVYYKQKYVNSGAEVINGSGMLEYKIPKIEGYKANLSFYKVDDVAKPIQGVSFVLQHQDCVICDEVNLTPITAISDATGYVQFQNIPSGHNYVLQEITPEAYAYIDDISITVTNGQVYQTVVNDIPSSWYITNTVVDPIQIQLQGQKTMDGSIEFEQPFQFVMKGINQEGKEITEITNSKDEGNFAFSTLTFNKSGTYEYTIKEVVDNDTDIIYDGSEHTVKIVVSKVRKDTTYFEATVQVDDQMEQTITGTKDLIHKVYVATFENETREKAVVQFEGVKELVGRDMKDQEFSFVLRNANGKVIETVKNDSEGNIVFTPLEYTNVGEYRYTISEEDTHLAAITYDKNVYDVTVNVSAPVDVTKEDAYQATVVYQKNGVVENVVFTNHYLVQPTSLHIEGQKQLIGKALEANTFEFGLYQENTLLQTVKNNDQGIFAFDIPVANVSNTTYTIKEIPNALLGIVYDTTIYTVQVDAKDNNGLLQVDVLINGEKDVPIVFNNQYIVKPVSYTIFASKEYKDMDGVRKELKGNDFTFVLENVDMKYTAQNDRDGKVAFVLEYTQPGVYHYTLHEQVEDNGIIFDTRKYTVDITVEDIEQILQVTNVQSMYNQNVVDTIVFVNQDTFVETSDSTTMYVWLFGSLVSLVGIGLFYMWKKH